MAGRRQEGERRLVLSQASDVIALTGHTRAEHEVNLAEDPRHAEEQKAMEALLLSEQQRLDDPYRL